MALSPKLFAVGEPNAELRQSVIEAVRFLAETGKEAAMQRRTKARLPVFFARPRSPLASARPNFSTRPRQIG
jgi:hypothetical protein